MYVDGNVLGRGIGGVVFKVGLSELVRVGFKGEFIFVSFGFGFGVRDVFWVVLKLVNVGLYEGIVVGSGLF